MRVLSNENMGNSHGELRCFFECRMLKIHSLSLTERRITDKIDIVIGTCKQVEVGGEIMKKRYRVMSIVMTLFLSVGTFAGYTPHATAAVDYSFEQTGATNNSATFSWKSDKGVDIYVDSQLVKRNVTAKSYTLKKSGMSAGMKYTVVLVETGKPSADGSVYAVRTKPTMIPISKIAYNKDTGITTVKWEPNSLMCDGYQISVDALSGNGGGCGYAADPNDGDFDLKLENNRFYKIRIRGYIQFRRKRVFGAWSDYRYLATMPDATFTKAENVTIHVAWKKVKNVSKYVISVGYISDGSDGIVTSTLTSKKTSVDITKIGKDLFTKVGKTYFVSIKPFVKVGKKQIASDIITVGPGIPFFPYDK